MKAIVLNEYGDSSHLKLAEIPEPKPGAGEIKVKVAAAGLNPIDWKLRSGDYKAFMPIQFPFVPGVDVSGQVVELGPGVTQFKVDDRVLGFVKRGYAEFVTALDSSCHSSNHRPRRRETKTSRPRSQRASHPNKPWQLATLFSVGQRPKAKPSDDVLRPFVRNCP